MDRVTLEEDLALVRDVDAGDGLDQGGLSGAVVPTRAMTSPG